MPTRVKDILFGTLAPSEKGPAMSQLELSRDGAREAETLAVTDTPAVDDSEKVARVLEHPIQVDLSKVDLARDLYYTPSAFRDVYVRGLSIQRLSIASVDEVENFGRKRAEERGKKYLGITVANVAQIRTFQQEGRSLLSVYATCMADFLAHADVFSHVTLTPAEKETVKYIFWELFDCRELVKEHLAAV